MSNSRIAYLDGLRGVAIIAVVLFHAYSRWEDVEPFEQVDALQTAFSMGWLGVQLFFAISGYVIYMTLLKSENILMFGVSRYLRLAPTMLLASLLIFLLSFSIPERPNGAARLIDFLPSITFVDPELLTKITGYQVRSIEGVFWTLYIEVKFYFLAAFLYFVLKDRELNGLLIGYLGYLAVVLLREFGIDHEALALAHRILTYIGFEHYGWFLLGIYTYKYVSRGRKTDTFLLAFVTIVAAAHLITPKEYSDGLLGAVVIAILLFLLPVFSERLNTLLSRPALLFFGFVSYPLYLVHENLVTGLAIKLHNSGVAMPSFLYPVPFIILAVLMAWLLARLEPGMKNQIRKWLPFRIFGLRLVRSTG